MSYHLARKLSRYYTRTDDNKIVFPNGLSLNKMAWHLYELGAKGIYPESLSRILSGERLFTPLQLEIFGEALELSEREIWELTYALLRDACERLGFDFELSASLPVVNLLVRNVETLAQAIDEKEFHAAINMLRDLYVAKAELDGEIMPSVPLMRVISLVETERSNLMYALARSTLSETPWEAEEMPMCRYKVDTVQDPITSLQLSEVEKRVWQQYYVAGQTLTDVARAEELTDATVYAMLENIKHRLLQRLADHEQDQPGH